MVVQTVRGNSEEKGGGSTEQEVLIDEVFDSVRSYIS
jgi:hypothetical protein